MNKAKKITAAILALLLVVSVSACGTTGTTSAPQTQSSPASSDAQGVGQGGTTQLEVDEKTGITTTTHPWFRGDYTIYTSNEGDVAKKTPEDTIVYANSSQIKAADPNTFQNEFSWSQQVYDCLIERDLTGESEFIPGLATEWGYDKDGNFSITLRDGVKFHDGTILNADDVLFTLQRVAKSPVNKCASSMRHIDFDKSFKTDDLHLTLVFKSPVGSLINDLACGYCGIMSKEFMEANPDTTLLDCDAGSGAYMLVESVSGISQTFERFDDYYGGAADVKYIIYKLYKDYSVMAIDFMNGDLDVCFNNNFNTVSQFMSGSIPGATLYQVPSRSIYLDLTTRGDVPLADTRLRQALAHCIDYAGLVKAVFQDTTMASPTNGPFPVGTKYEVNLGTIEYDATLAQSLLAECGYSTNNPCKLKLLSTNSPTGEAAAAIVQQFGSLVGFDIDVTIMDSAGANDINGLTEVPSEYDLFVCTNSFNTGSPEAFLCDREMYTDPENASAMSGIDDARMNELAQKAADSVDEEERAALYAELQQLFYDELWTIQLSISNCMVLAHSYVGEIQFVSGYHPKFATMSLVD